jgi:subtilisin-like proprotein convertase family protein
MLLLVVLTLAQAGARAHAAPAVPAAPPAAPETGRASGSILVINDEAGAFRRTSEGRVAVPTGLFSVERDRAGSANEIAQDLTALGYTVTQENAAASDTTAWGSYDFIVWASSDNADPVGTGSYRSSLESYVGGGGKLLIEGGELGYVSGDDPGYPSFATNVLHISGWVDDESGSLLAFAPGHPVVTTPNLIDSIACSYSDYGDQDAVTPTLDADVVCDWSFYAGSPGVLVYDDTPDPASGQIVYLTFDYMEASALSPGRTELLENIAAYLTAEETAPTGSISGHATLYGKSDHSGIKVTASPGDSTAYTNASGHYVIDGLQAATYSVRATKLGWSIEVADDIVVLEGQETENVDFTLYPLQEVTECSSPSLAIPDEYPAGVRDSVAFDEDASVTDVEVYVDITHTYVGDLIVEITSPEGTTVRLHDRSGEGGDSILGWYDYELPVDGPGVLSDFQGESCTGYWKIWVSDNDYWSTGTLNEWCVKLLVGLPGSGVDQEDWQAQADYVLGAAVPNPFNPMTTVSYAVHVDGPVLIAVHDVSGRRVRTLVDGPRKAGGYEARWDGRDEDGLPVASGVYFCRMYAGIERGETKLVLLK